MPLATPITYQHMCTRYMKEVGRTVFAEELRTLGTPEFCKQIEHLFRKRGFLPVETL